VGYEQWLGIAPTRALVPASRISLAVLDDTVLYEDEIASTMRYGRASKALNTLISYHKANKSMDVLSRYVRRGNLFKRHAGAAFL
jgi:hypothetical protein